MQEKIKVYTDGGSRGNPGIAGIGIYVESADGQPIAEFYKFLGNKTNNESEYLGFIEALKYLESLEEKPKEVEFFLDSKLVVEQINKNWKIKEARLRALAEEAWKILSTLPFSRKISHVVRAKNAEADRLANVAMDTGTSSI